jgi:hypothetical protein
VRKKINWCLERLYEPSTYKGLSLIAGSAGSVMVGGGEMGVLAMQIGIVVAGVISIVMDESK